MGSELSDRRNVTFIGKLATALARVSARYWRTIAQQVDRIVRGAYRIYLRFEAAFVSAVTDLLLFIWALRSFVIIIVIQFALVASALRWPLMWIPAVAFAVLLVTAAREMSGKDWREDEDAVDDDSTRDAIFIVVRLFLRICLLVVGLGVTCFLIFGKYGSLRTAVYSSEPPSELSSIAVAAILEPSWNYYAREEIFLGTTYFGNTTSFGRYGGAPLALALESDYPVYRALAARRLITIKPFRLDELPSAVRTSGASINHAATVGLTNIGGTVGINDTLASTVTFVFGTYGIEKITTNIPIRTSEGIYRHVEGEHAFDLVQQFSSLWAEVGRPTYRERRFRVVLQYDTTEAKWKVAHASNGRFTAEDTGPRNGDFDSANVPATVAELRRNH